MRRYRKLSSKTRVPPGCLSVALVPLTFSSVTMTRLFTAPINRQITADGNQQLEEVRERSTQLLESYQKACETLTEDGSAAWITIDDETVEFQKDLYLSIYQVVQEIYSHAQFCIYDAGEKLRFTTDTALRNSHLPVNQGLLNRASEKQGITYHRADPYLPSSDSDVLMWGVFPLESTHNARTECVILNFARENFDSLLSGSCSSGDTLPILDSHQKPLYCSRLEYGEHEISDIIRHAISDQGGTGRKGVHTKYLWTGEPFQGFYTPLRCSIPISTSAVCAVGMVNLTLSGLGLMLYLLTAGALSRGIGQPMSLLDEAMARVKKGDLSTRIRTNRRDGLSRLTESFNQITGDLQKYLDNTMQKQKDSNKTTLRLYQTQLNSHLLYNTLDSIKWSARINQVPEIAVLAENLTVILRGNISSRPFITLREELEVIENYAEIRKICFTGRFLYETEIPDQLEGHIMPRIMLQPLVENVIIHGLDGCEHGYICIYAFRKEGILNISVTDDECDVSRGVADWINSGAPAKRDGHLGLYNVINISKIYYEQKHGIEAAITEDGTTVTFRLPVQEEVPDV